MLFSAIPLYMDKEYYKNYTKVQYIVIGGVLIIILGIVIIGVLI